MATDSHESLDKYRTIEGLDDSLAAMEARLKELQPSLAILMKKALLLFDGVHPNAPHPAHATDPPIAYATGSVNICPIEEIPMARELTVVLGTGKWIRVFRNTDSSPNDYPRERLWFWSPVDGADRQVNVMKTHSPRRVDYPYDIETADFRSGQCLGFVGGGPYFGQEPFITEVDCALDDAKRIAIENGFFTKSAE